MNELRVFENQEFGRIRSVTVNDEPWFVGKDVAMALGYRDTKNALKSHVDSEDKKGGWRITTPSGDQNMTIINESGVYALIFGSRLPSAKKFKHWVTSEVLPSIRKTGSYGQFDVATLITQTAVAVCTELVRQLTPVLQGMVAARPAPVVMAGSAELETENYKTGCKLETFPEDIRLQVDQMFDQMLEQQALNFSMIARYCTMNGFPISQPSVKVYYQRHFVRA
ncbi:MAG: Bro-N domain-containing protein [Lachnospiraceae bacterium]|nr:Bro-N domain-containing protein [Lachnospiraceae bacterium]MCM1241001.1 Bro-N domain-containing protein [Lachnospiraceae bacterium]